MGRGTDILACHVLQVMALLRTAGGAPIQSWAPDQDEHSETLWAEMGLQPDAHITLVTYHVSACLIKQPLTSTQRGGAGGGGRGQDDGGGR